MLQDDGRHAPEEDVSQESPRGQPLAGGAAAAATDGKSGEAGEAEVEAGQLWSLLVGQEKAEAKGVRSSFSFFPLSS